MESCDGPVLREIIGSSFTGEVPSVRDGPSVAVPPKTEKETDKRIPASACPEPEEPPTSSTFLPKQNGGHATLQQDDHAAPPQGLTTAPPPCGGYKVQTKEESKPRDGLTCVHCSLVLRNAMQTEDGCRVCLSCYQEVKSKGGSCEDCGLVIKDDYSVSPDFAARKEIDKLEVLCRNSGCGWSGYLKLLEAHETRECDFRKICCHHCAKLVARNAMEDHVVNTCDHRSVKCEFCYVSVKQFELEGHHQSCGKFLVNCVDCNQLVPREELNNHQEDDCDYIQCSVCEETMLRSTLAEHLKDHGVIFKHFASLAKQVKHLREEVKCQQQWLAEAENKAKSASPASSDTSAEALKLIQALTKRVDIMEEEQESRAEELAAAARTIQKQAEEIAALKEEVKKSNQSLRTHQVQHNSGQSYSALNQSGDLARNFNFFSQPASDCQLMQAITRIQGEIQGIERSSARAQSAQQEHVGRLDKIEKQVHGLAQQISRDSASGQSSKAFEGVIDFPEATTGELFPSGGFKKGAVLEQRVEELERNINALSVQVADTDLQLQASLVTTYNGQFVWRIPDLSRRLRDAKQGKVTSIYSPPFYTSKSGYKMCIRTYLNGDGMGEKTHLSVFFVIMKGEHDALLPWPFQSRISLMLLNQENGPHIMETFRPNPASKSFQRPTSEMNVASGCPRFASLTTLTNPAFVKNDVLFIKCLVDTSGLTPP